MGAGGYETGCGEEQWKVSFGLLSMLSGVEEVFGLDGRFSGDSVRDWLLVLRRVAECWNAPCNG